MQYLLIILVGLLCAKQPFESLATRLSVEDSDVFHTYGDFWRTRKERENTAYQGIDLSKERNVTRLRIGADNADKGIGEDVAIADAYGNRFCTQLDFELLETHKPFDQSALQTI